MDVFLWKGTFSLSIVLALGTVMVEVMANNMVYNIDTDYLCSDCDGVVVRYAMREFGVAPF